MLYIFDLDGTLTDTLTTIAHFGNAALAECGYDTIPVSDYRRLVGDGRDTLIRRMLAVNGVDTSDGKNNDIFLKVRGVYDNGYENNTMYLTKPYDGIIDALYSLKEGGNTLAVLSNKPHNVVLPIVDGLFPKGLFDAVYGQRDGIALKPDPQAALSISEELGFEASDCVFVGDTNVDILTGKNAGMKTAGVLWGFRDREELEKAGADVIVTVTSDIAILFRENLPK